MRVLRTISAGTIACSIAFTATGFEQPLSLTDAVQQTLEANLDLTVQREQLDANREQIGITRSALLPQISGGLQGQILDDDRPDGARGNASEKSATVFAEATQVLYDEDAWAGYAIQKHVYTSQEQQLVSFRLGVIANAASTFLELERAEAVVAVQMQNRELTRKNIETAKERVAAGYSGERDVLRWESQLAANDTAVVRAQTEVLVRRFELNRVRNRAREEPIELSETRLEDYGFAYSREPIAQAAANEQGGRALRDFMVRVGLSRSPALASIAAAIEAEERQLTANRRSFWVPSLELGAGVNHLAAKDSSSGSSTTYNDTEWGVRAGLSLPVFEGGGRLSAFRQSRYTLSSLRAEQRATRQSVDESIRAAFAQATGSYVSLGHAREQRASAQRNFDLVNESYVAGVTSILELLDAQSQLVNAQLGVTGAYYGFLVDLMTAEQAISLFAFLEPKADVTALIDQLERDL